MDPIQIIYELQVCNIPSSVLFYHRRFCVASLWFEKEQQPAYFRFNLVSTSTSRHFRISSEQSLSRAPSGVAVSDHTEWKGQEQRPSGRETAGNHCGKPRHESMRKETRSMTKLGHLIPQNTPEVLSCISLGNSVVKQCLFSGFSLSGRKGSSHIYINWMKTIVAISKDGHFPAQRTNEASGDLMVALTHCSVDLVFWCLLASLRTLA